MPNTLLMWLIVVVVPIAVVFGIYKLVVATATSPVLIIVLSLLLGVLVSWGLPRLPKVP